MALAAP
jgi:hypothetical protein